MSISFITINGVDSMSTRTPVSPQPIIHANPKNTVLVFDMNGVLFTPNWKEAVKTGLKTLCNGTVIRELIKIKKQYPHNSFALRDAGKDAASCQIPYIPVWNAIHACKEQGYAIYLFTNSCPETYASIKNKFPHLFSCIDGTIHVGPQHNWIKKPNPRYYAICTSQLQQDGHGDKRVLFFDNDAKNLVEADKLHWDTVLVTDPNSCITALHRRNIHTIPKNKLPPHAFQPMAPVCYPHFSHREIR